MEADTLRKQANSLAKELSKGLTISVSKNSWKKSVEDFKKAVVIKLVTGESFNVFTLANVLRKAWGVGERDVAFEEIAGNMAVVKFRSEAKVEEVMEGGPWSFNNTLVMIRKWIIGTKPENLDFGSVHLWVQIHNIPQELMHDEVTKEIAEGVGKVIKERQEQVGVKKRIFARYKVEVGVKAKIPEGAIIDLEDGEVEPFWVDFKFERLPSICERCRVMAHRSSSCPEQAEEMSMVENAMRGVVAACEAQVAGKDASGGTAVVVIPEEGERSDQSRFKARGIDNKESSRKLDVGKKKELIINANNGSSEEVWMREAEGSLEERGKSAKINNKKSVGKEKINGQELGLERGCSWAGGGLSWADSSIRELDVEPSPVEMSQPLRAGKRGDSNEKVYRKKNKTNCETVRFHPYQQLRVKSQEENTMVNGDQEVGEGNGDIEESNTIMETVEFARQLHRHQ